MKIETAYQEGLKKLIKEKPLDEINVVMLCDECNSNRQTFYYHFRDISDVVESIFLKAKVGYAKKLLDYEPILKEMVNYINANYNFVSAINKSYSQEKLYSFMFSYFYSRIGALLKNHKIDGIEITRYMSTLSANELIYWVGTKRKEKIPSLIRRLNTIFAYFVNQYQSDLKRNRF